MAVTSNCFLEHARSLAKRGDEISLRSAISRAYYSVYHRLKAYPDRFSLRTEAASKGAHDQLIRTLRNADSGVLKHADSIALTRVAQELAELRDMRSQADYHLDQTVTADDWEVAIYKIECLFEDLDAFEKTNAA